MDKCLLLGLSLFFQVIFGEDMIKRGVMRNQTGTDLADYCAERFIANSDKFSSYIVLSGHCLFVTSSNQYPVKKRQKTTRGQ